jgi:hypothetical protein
VSVTKDLLCVWGLGRNQVGIGLSYRPARLCSLATQFQTWFLESIPRLVAGLKFSAQMTAGSGKFSRQPTGGRADALMV